MKQLELLQEYLKGLYEAYDTLQTDYARLHKRSKMHNKETVGDYYLRWRDKMRAEIRRIELVLMKGYVKPTLSTEDAMLNVEKKSTTKCSIIDVLNFYFLTLSPNS